LREESGIKVQQVSVKKHIAKAGGGWEMVMNKKGWVASNKKNRHPI